MHLSTQFAALSPGFSFANGSVGRKGSPWGFFWESFNSSTNVFYRWEISRAPYLVSLIHRFYPANRMRIQQELSAARSIKISSNWLCISDIESNIMIIDSSRNHLSSKSELLITHTYVCNFLSSHYYVILMRKFDLCTFYFLAILIW